LFKLAVLRHLVFVESCINKEIHYTIVNVEIGVFLNNDGVC